MIKFDFLNDCTGCAVCADSCPKHCISMVKNKYGFMMPSVDLRTCVDCRKCERVCPVLNTRIAHNASLKLYCAYNVNAEERKKGSSGSIMLVLAKYVINQNGVVYGAAFDENLKLRHTRATSMDDVILQAKSKYIQSDTRGIYRLVKADLQVGKNVLFVGTPCQCQALNNYLGKERTNKLLLVDFICHGVPSQELFDKSIARYEFANKCKVIDFSFRKKNDDSLRNYFMRFLKDGKIFEKEGEARSFPFYCGYLKYIAFRESCYHCKFVGKDRITDFTLGDFWGLQNTMQGVEFNKGYSMLIVNSILGKEIFESIKKFVDYKEYELSSPFAKNHAYLLPTQKSIMHSMFMRDYLFLPYEKLEKRYFMWNKKSLNWIVYAIIKKLGL